MSPINIEFAIADDAWSAEHQVVIKIAIAAAVKQLELPAVELSILLTNDAEIKRLNQEFRGKNAATNVLSFPQAEHVPYQWQLTADAPLGDIALAHETIAAEAAQEGRLFAHHLSHLTIHGFLHILGFDHMNETDATIMEQLEIALLHTLSIANPYV